MELKQGYEKMDVANSRFEIMNSGKSQLTIEDATVFLSWAVDGDKIKAMLHGEISEQVFYAMLRTFGKDFPDMVRQAVVRYIAGCIYPPRALAPNKTGIEAGLADGLAAIPSLRGGTGDV